jgi:hypothetical protein
MSHHVASFTLFALLSASAFACDKPGVTEQQRETKANEQAANSRNEAERQAQGSQATAERDIAAARADFEKARADYMHGRQRDLIDVDKKIVDLDTNARPKTGKTKAELDTRLPSIHAQRDAFARHMQALDTATPSTWDADRANLDKEWDSLKTAVDSAR